MNLTERDAYILDLFARLARSGFTGRQAVLEAIRVAGFANVALPGHDGAALDADVSGMQAAVAALASASTRSAAKAAYNGAVAVPSGILPTYVVPIPTGLDKTTAWQMRAFAAGA